MSLIFGQDTRVFNSFCGTNGYFSNEILGGVNRLRFIY